MRKPVIQTYNASDLNYFVSCIGDSLTQPSVGPVGMSEMWPAVLGKKLRRAGCNVTSCNFGRDGCKTDNLGVGMLARSKELNMFNQPQMGVIWGGTNDFRDISGITRTSGTATATSVGHAFTTGARVTITGADQTEYNVTNVAITVLTADTFTFPVTGTPATPATGTLIQVSLQTALNIRSMILFMKFGCSGVVQLQTDLPALTPVGTRYVVLQDTSSSGGISAADSIYDATITGALSGTPPSVWECRNRNGGVTGWSRVFKSDSTPTHTTKFLVLGNHYLNYSTGGDNHGTSTVNAGYLVIRTKQATVPALETGHGAEVLFVNNYQYLQDLITNGLETQGSFSWHVADGNVHLNQLGHNYIAESIFSVIPDSWIELMTKP